MGGTDSYSITITGDPKVIDVSLYEVRHVASQNIMYRLSNSSSETSEEGIESRLAAADDNAAELAQKDVEDLLNSQGDINNFTERKKSVVEITSKQDND